MASEAVWQTECPICKGSGKIAVIRAVSKNALRKNASEGHETPCEVCDGTGQIMVVKKFRKRGK